MTVNIGIIGLGTVGGGVYDMLVNRSDRINERVNGGIRVKKVCDIREDLGKDMNLPPGVFTKDYRDILNDSEISLVAVLTGNTKVALKIINECFENSKHVVTANKALLAGHWKEIFKKASECNSILYFEASVGSGIPVIQGINEGMAANRIDRVKGVLNGTTNYMLTRMEKEGLTMQEAEKAAIEAGFAEPDSSADINGLDAAHKICVLANVIFKTPVNLDDVYCEGISGLELQDIKLAKEMFGFDIKLLSVINVTSKGVEVRVHPSFLPSGDVLSGVKDEYNGILVRGDASGEVMFYGKGAGRYPAASAVVSDIIYVAQKINYGIAGKIPFMYTDTSGSTPVLDMENLSFQYYLRFKTIDKPGVLSTISGVLGKYNVSILSCYQKGRAGEEVPIVMVTHRALEGNLKKALSEIDEMGIIKKKTVFIRLESDMEIY